jgi:integrase
MTILMEFVRYLRCPDVSHMKFRIKAERGEVFWLERSEVIHLFRTAPSPRCMAAEVVLAFTGIREKELRELRIHSVTDDWLHITAGKGRKARKIPIDEEFWQMLRPYLEWRREYSTKWPDSPYFLVHPENAGFERGPLVPFAEGGISDMLWRHGMSEGIKHSNSHPWRRFFGRDLFENDCPVSQIQRYYGHSSEQQTLDYIGVTQEMDVNAMRKYRRSYLADI